MEKLCLLINYYCFTIQSTYLVRTKDTKRKLVFHLVRLLKIFPEYLTSYCDLPSKRIHYQPVAGFPTRGTKTKYIFFYERKFLKWNGGELTKVGLITSDALKIKVNTIVMHYSVYFDFQCIRRYKH